MRQRVVEPPVPPGQIAKVFMANREIALPFGVARIAVCQALVDGERHGYAIMREVAEKLSTELMVVGVPTEHGFFATSESAPAQVDTMIRWARDEFDRAQKRRISPIPFLVDARGELVGLVTTTPATPEDGTSSAKPWWKFW